MIEETLPHHLIRLRGGWELIDLEGPCQAPARLVLPASRSVLTSRKVRLVRRFGRPPYDPSRETLLLSLHRVEGLHSLSLNGRSLTVQATGVETAELTLSDLNDRNELILHVELRDPSGASSTPSADWGEIALVIRRNTSAGPSLGFVRPAR